MFEIDLQQSPPDALAGLGLAHDYPLHIDVLNNETGFALYVETPAYFYAISDSSGGELFVKDDDSAATPVHANEYVPGMEPTYEYDDWYEDLYLRIREVDEEGVAGAWHTTQLALSGFIKNTNPPIVLADADFDRFDSVTWLNGLESGKDYQVQLWFDMDDDGQLDTQGRYERGILRTYHADGTVTEEPDDWYYWQEADVYSSIHNLNTDAEDFNIDIDADGDMDYFSQDCVAITTIYDIAGYDTLDLSDDTHNQRIDLRPGHFSDVYGETHNLVIADDAVIEAVIAGAGDDTIHGNDSPNRLMGRAGDDTLTGGGGSDRFAFYANEGHDTILDFTDNEDKIDLRPIAAIESMEDLTIIESDDSLVIYLDDEQSASITLQGFELADLTADDFLFA